MKRYVLLIAITAFAITTVAEARRVMSKRPFRPAISPGDVHFRTPFAMLDPVLMGGRAPVPSARMRSLSGNVVAAFGSDVIAIDEDSGKLLMTDDRSQRIASLSIGSGAGQLVLDQSKGLIFVADRVGDRIAVVAVGDKSLKLKHHISVKQEPFGLALTPDGKTLLVTTVADHQLTAYSTKTGKERWSIDLAPEPRGIAISPDGKEATISFLTSSAVGRVKLADDGTKLGIRYISLNRERSSAKAGGFIAAPSFRRHRSFGTAPDGKRFARNAFATTYIGNGLNVVAFQGSTPRANTESARETRGTYGGGGGRFAPVVHRLALVAGDEHRGARQVARAHIDIHQPRAMAYDETTDTLYIAGAGSDSVMAVESVSQPTIQMAWRQVIPKKDGMRCAPTGIDVAADGDIVVFCSLTRSIARIERTKKHTSVVVNGPELAKSKLSKLEMAGKELFTRGNNTQTSVLGAMACSSCHPEGRTDGLSWRIEGKSLQTPILAGRVMGTHPFKWDGQDKNLQSSLINTVRRLGGSGISVKQAKQLTAFLDTLKPPRAPTIEDHKAVTRGKKLFGSKTLGCASCHSGAKLTDGASYELASDIEKVDTPSLIGIAHSAPYYHDGSATTLRSLLLENGTIHGMGNVKNMTNPQVDDLIAYLETL